MNPTNVIFNSAHRYINPVNYRRQAVKAQTIGILRYNNCVPTVVSVSRVLLNILEKLLILMLDLRCSHCGDKYYTGM